MTVTPSSEQHLLDSPFDLQLLHSARMPEQTETTLVANLENRGAQPLYEVETRLLVSEVSDYTTETWRSPDRKLGSLSPGEQQIVEFTVLPKNLRDPYIDVNIEVTYQMDWESERLRTDFRLRVPLSLGIRETASLKNPYVTGEPLDPRYSASMFFGRRELIHEITTNLMGRYEQNILILHGQRRIGKTSLLLQLRHEHLKPPYYPVFIDIQGLVDIGTHSFLYRLCRSIEASLAETGIPVEAPSRRSILEGGFGCFDEFLDRVGAALHNGKLVMLLDEFEELDKRVQDGKLDADIFSFIRSQMQHRRWLLFIFAGTHKLEELSRDYFSIFFNTAIYMDIGYLNEAEAEQLIRQPVLPQITYEERAVRRVKEASLLHPYFIQLICHYLVELLHREGRSKGTVQDVEAVVDEITRGDVGHLDYLWQRSNEPEQHVLSALAELQRPLHHIRNFSATCPEIRRQIEKSGKRLPQEVFWQAIESLKARDLVRETQSVDLAYGITFELFSRWIREKHPRGA